jgi:DNA methylase
MSKLNVDRRKGVRKNNPDETQRSINQAANPETSAPKEGTSDARKSLRAEVFAGNNADILATFLHDQSVCGKVMLAYIDPPFGTGRNFGAYDDRWQGGRTELVSELRKRIELIHALLHPEGSILVHIDHRISHLIAVVLDEVFGPGDRDPSNHTQAGFRNEIIWSYGLGGSSPRFYPRKHDTILWYTKGVHWHFQAPMIHATSARMKGQMKKRPDVFDIPSINNMAIERVGFPTQKPLELLDIFVHAHTQPGDLVLDAFCGSGTTLVAARRAGRSAIGIDEGDEAIRVSRERLQKVIDDETL